MLEQREANSGFKFPATAFNFTLVCNHFNRVCVFVIKKLSLGLGIFVLQQNCLGKTGISRKCLAIGVGGWFVLGGVGVRG